jgi:ABC-2 type transport system ATP-binding protein
MGQLGAFLYKDLLKLAKGWCVLLFMASTLALMLLLMVVVQLNSGVWLKKWTAKVGAQEILPEYYYPVNQINAISVRNPVVGLVYTCGMYNFSFLMAAQIQELASDMQNTLANIAINLYDYELYASDIEQFVLQSPIFQYLSPFEQSQRVLQEAKLGKSDWSNISSASLFLQNINQEGYSMNIQTYKIRRSGFVPNGYNQFYYNIPLNIEDWDLVPGQINYKNRRNVYIPTEAIVNTMNRFSNLKLMNATASKPFTSKTKYDPLIKSGFFPVYDSDQPLRVVKFAFTYVSNIAIPITFTFFIFFFVQNAVYEKQSKIHCILQVLNYSRLKYWTSYLLVAFSTYFVMTTLFFAAARALQIPNDFFVLYSQTLIVAVISLWSLFQFAMFVSLSELIADHKTVNQVFLGSGVITVMFFTMFLERLYPYPGTVPFALLIIPFVAFPRFFYHIVVSCSGFQKCITKVEDSDSEVVTIVVSLACSCVLMLVVDYLVIRRVSRRKTSLVQKHQLNGILNVEPEVDTGNFLEIKNLVFEYGNGKRALDGVNLSIRSKGVFGLIGPNGAGKTTLFSILVGSLRAKSGSVSINGQDIGTKSANISYCPQFDSLWTNFSVREHLNFFYRFKDISAPDRGAHVDSLLEKLNLRGESAKLVSELSGGMRRRLSIGCALILDPDVMYLDEPSTGLDIGNRRALWETIRRIGETKLVIISTHLMEEADYLCGEIGIIDEGRMKVVCTPAYLKSKYFESLDVQVTSKDSAEEKSRLLALIEEAFPRCEVTLQVYNVVNFKLNKQVEQISTILETLSSWKDSGLIRNFSFRNIGLEEAVLEELRT